MISVAIQNKSTILKDADLAAAVPDLQIQVSRDFAPIWGVDAQLILVPSNQLPPANAWLLVALDNSDQAGALGYHEIQSLIPYGLFFVESDIQAGLSWTVTASHELLEMLVDPWVFSTVMIDQGRSLFGTTGVALAQEVADACESDQFGYKINNTLVSDFVTPAWFGASSGNKFDFAGHCSQAFQLLTGGYIGLRSYRAGQWSQQTAQASLVPKQDSEWAIVKQDGTLMQPHEIPFGSRRQRRLAGFKTKLAPNKMGIFGPVRNDIDAAAQHAEYTMAQADNLLKWLETLVAGITTGKKVLKTKVDQLDPLTTSMWLENRV